MNRYPLLTGQLVLLAVSVFIADWLQEIVEIIPDWLVHLPAVDYPPEDFWIVFQYFLVIHAVILWLFQQALGPWAPHETRRTVHEVFGLAVAFSASSLAVFMTTTVVFDPQFVVWIFVVNAIVTIAIHLSISSAEQGIGSALIMFVRITAQRLFSIPGVLALLVAVLPGVTAKLFVSDRDFANIVTQTRIYFADDAADTSWTVENALGKLKFHQPIALQFHPRDDQQMYLMERHGRLWSVPWQKAGQPDLLIDFSESVGEVEVENGALGFDLHPEFGRDGSPNAGDLYAYYTSVINKEQVNRLVRFDLTAGDPDAIRATESLLIEWDRDEGGFHNGGSVEFGPDGFLYVGLGEGVGGRAAHQRIDSAIGGGLIRIDVDQIGGNISHPIVKHPDTGLTQGYFIPSDNPFSGQPGVLEEYFALGLRNPFRFSFDEQNGNIWAGDVGSTVWEEVNLIVAGSNYQYPYAEGNELTGKKKPEFIVGKETLPVYTYEHTAFDRAVIGGIVYRGAKYPELRGQYLFGDNYSGSIYMFPANQRDVDSVKLLAKANQFAQRGITSFIETPDGEILLTTLGSASGSNGEVIRLVPEEQATHTDDAPVTDEPVSDEQVESLFRENCARCHGMEGRGDGPDANQMDVPMPDFANAGFQSSRTDDHLGKVIRDGGVANNLSAMMPPWGFALTDNEIRGLVSLIRQQGQQGQQTE